MIFFAVIQPIPGIKLIPILYFNELFSKFISKTKCKYCGVMGRVYYDGPVVYIGHQYDRGTVISCPGEGEKKPTLMRRKKPTLMRRKKTLRRRK